MHQLTTAPGKTAADASTTQPTRRRGKKAPFVVSVHIPKTAGTTVANVFDRVYHRRVIYDYDGYANPTKPNAEIARNSEFVQKYFAVLHGHFYVQKYDRTFPDAALVSTVRHPVERVISQYLHELNERSSDAWYHDLLISGQMDVVEFAEQPGVGDAMSLHLAARPVEEYAQILLTERLYESLALFSRRVRPLLFEDHFGYELPVENSRVQRPETRPITEAMRAAIYDRTQIDNELYARCEEMHERNMKKYL